MEQQISSWKEKYAEVKSTLMQMGKVESAATAFNTNVDAVCLLYTSDAADEL